jgi:hypothetical protein
MALQYGRKKIYEKLWFQRSKGLVIEVSGFFHILNTCQFHRRIRIEGSCVKNSSFIYLLIYGLIGFLYSGGNGHSLRVLILISCVMETFHCDVHVFHEKFNYSQHPLCKKSSEIQ